MKKIVLQIQGMTCQHCVQAVQKAIESVEGTDDVQVDLQSGEAEFFLEDEAQLDHVKQAIQDAGYEVN